MVRRTPARKSSTVEAPTKARLGDVGRGAKLGPGSRNAAKHPAAGRAGTMRYLVVIERTKTGFSAYSPDLEGCVAAARTRPSVLRAMQKAVEFHLEGLRLQ